jgi:tetratricopeptide (TPR) repeat protein
VVVDRFGPATRLLARQAIDLATREESREVNASHFLSQLLDSPHFAVELRACGLTHELLAPHLARVHEAGSDPSPPFSLGMGKALNAALKTAGRNTDIDPGDILQGICSTEAWLDDLGVDRGEVLAVARKHTRRWYRVGELERKELARRLWRRWFMRYFPILFLLCAFASMYSWLFEPAHFVSRLQTESPQPFRFLLANSRWLLPVLPIGPWCAGLLAPEALFEDWRRWNSWMGWSLQWRRLTLWILGASFVGALFIPRTGFPLLLILLSLVTGIWCSWRIDARRWGLEGVPPQLRRLRRKSRRAVFDVAFALNMGTFLNWDQALDIVDSAINDARERGASALEARLFRFGIEVAINRGWLHVAESRSQAALAEAGYNPEVVLARATVLRLLGRSEEGLELCRTLLSGASDGETSPQWQVGYLELLAESAASLGECEGILKEARHALTKAGDPVLVARGFLALGRKARLDGAFLYAEGAARDALDVLRIHELVAFPLQDRLAILRAKAVALESLGWVLACRREWKQASEAFLAAHSMASSKLTVDRVLGGTSVINAVACATQTEIPDDDSLLHGLGLVRAGLQIIESERGPLRVGESRAGLLSRWSDTYDGAFRVVSLVQEIGDPAGVGLAAWMLESMRRSATARLLRDSGSQYSPAIRELFQRLDELEQVSENSFGSGLASMSSIDGHSADLRQIREMVAKEISNQYAAVAVPELMSEELIYSASGHRDVLIYQVAQDTEEWVVRGVWLGQSGNSHFFTNRTSTEVLDPFGMGGRSLVRSLAKESQSTLWRHLSEILLPAPLLDSFCLSETPTDLLVLPAGPLTGLPFAALPVGERVLGDYATLSYTASLSALRSAPAPSPPFTGAVVHLGNQVDTTLEQQAWTRNATSLGPVQFASNRAELRQLLAGSTASIAYLSGHGRGMGVSQTVQMSDGEVSAASALDIDWPPIVVFGACCSSRLDLRPGIEPIALPISCLLSGARWVIGGMFDVPDRWTGDILAVLIDNLAAGIRPPAALRLAQQSVRDFLGFRARPFHWAGLTVWEI